MGVPFEALLPYGIMLAVRSFDRTSTGPANEIKFQMFGITGAGMAKIRHMQNGGKRGRHSVDQWDKVRMHHSLGRTRPSLLTLL